MLTPEIHSCSFLPLVLARSLLQTQWSHGPDSVRYVRWFADFICGTSIPHPRDAYRKEYVIQVWAVRCEGMSLVELLAGGLLITKKKDTQNKRTFCFLGALLSRTTGGILPPALGESRSLSVLKKHCISPRFPSCEMMNFLLVQAVWNWGLVSFAAKLTQVDIDLHAVSFPKGVKHTLGSPYGRSELPDSSFWF